MPGLSASLPDDFSELATVVPPELTEDDVGHLLAGGTPCEHCGSFKGVKQVNCMTAYADESKNVRPFYCEECAANYYDYWQAMWDEYRSSQGV